MFHCEVFLSEMSNSFGFVARDVFLADADKHLDSIYLTQPCKDCAGISEEILYLSKRFSVVPLWDPVTSYSQLKTGSVIKGKNYTVRVCNINQIICI